MAYERLDLGLEYLAGMRAPVVEQAGYGIVVDETGLNVKYVAMYGGTDGRPVDAPDGWAYYDTDLGAIAVMSGGEWGVYAGEHTVTSTGYGVSVVSATSSNATALKSIASSGYGIEVSDWENGTVVIGFDSDVIPGLLPSHAKAFSSEAFSADFTFNSPGKYQTCDDTGDVELDLDDTGAVLFAQHYKYIPANQIDTLTATSALSADPDVFANFDPTKPYGVMAVWLPPGVPWVTGMVLPS